MKTMLRVLRIATVAALVTCATAAPSFAETTIAVLNIPQIMQDATAAKSVREQIEKKQKEFQAELSRKEDDLQKEDQELAKQRSVLSPEAFEKKLREFRTKASEAQKQVRDKKAQLDKAFGQAIGDIQKTTIDIVAELAKERGFNIAIPTSELLYADPSMDISQEVLKRLNQKLPSLTVKF